MASRLASLLLATLLFAEVSVAQDRSSLAAVVATRYPSSDLRQESRGYLDDESTYHLAVVVTKDTEIVLLLIKEGKHENFTVVSEMSLGGANSRTSWTATIRNRSIFVSYDSSGGCCSHSGGTLQFKVRGRALRLIGYSELSLGLEIPSAEGGQVYYEARTSINLLTGDFQRWRTASRRIKPWSQGLQFEPNWRQFVLLPPLKRSVKKGHFRVDRPWVFGKFGTEDFMNWLLTKNVYDKRDS